jgi:ligand-binding SRPBCC domain-containing protein
MDFTVWLGPIPIRWLAQIEEVSPTGFVDRQLQGPFAQWQHRHTFVPIDEQTTQVIDEINFSYKANPWWKIVGWGMITNLSFLFAYRGWKTRRLLEKSQR